MFSIKEVLSPNQALSALLDDHFLTAEEAEELLTKSAQVHQSFVVICVRTDFTNNNVYKSLKDHEADHGSVCFLPYRQNEFIFVLGNSPSAEFCIQAATKIRAGLLKDTDTIFSIGISRERHKAEELYACRKEAQRACSATHMFGKNSIIHIDFLDSNEVEYIYPSHKEKRLIESTMDGDITYALQMLKEIFSVLKPRKIRQSLVNKIVLRILVGLNIAASSRVSSYEKMGLDSLSIKTLMSVRNIDEAHEFLIRGIYDFSGEMNEITDVTRDALFHKLSVSESIPESVDELALKFNTTLSFVNKAIYKNNKSDVFSLIREHNKADK